MKPITKKIQNAYPKHLVWNLLIFEHLDLFRISDFVLRVLCPLRFCASQCVFYAPFDNRKSKIQNRKYCWEVNLGVSHHRKDSAAHRGRRESHRTDQVRGGLAVRKSAVG